MKAVNVDEVLKILHRYGKYIFVTDEKKYSDMVDEIANLKAVEQELCGDAVSRKAALGMAKSYNTDGFDMYTPLVVDAEDIEELPPVTPQPRWIPVSEKLPEPFTFVNVTCRSLVDDRENWVIETLYLPIPKEANKHGYSDWGNIPMLNCGDAEVIAWVDRIIPQPYKGESEGKE